MYFTSTSGRRSLSFLTRLIHYISTRVPVQTISEVLVSQCVFAGGARGGFTRGGGWVYATGREPLQRHRYVNLWPISCTNWDVSNDVGLQTCVAETKKTVLVVTSDLRLG